MDTVFPERRGWFSEFYRDSQEWTLPGYRHWFEYEDHAPHMWVWATGMIHGLGQVPEYAEALLKTLPGVSPDQLSARLGARMERQRRVLYRDPPPSIWLLVDEMALYRMVGSPETMTSQLAHLLELVTLPGVTVQVVPAAAHAVIASELIVIDGAAYAEHVAGGYVFTEPETVTSLGRMITGLQADCYRASESHELIRRVKAVWESGVNPLTAVLPADRASKSRTARERS